MLYCIVLYCIVLYCIVCHSAAVVAAGLMGLLPDKDNAELYLSSIRPAACDLIMSKTNHIHLLSHYIWFYLSLRVGSSETILLQFVVTHLL